MGNLQLRHGDIFDGPSDLIVLPCSTTGTITRFVSEKLTRYNIPFGPERGMKLGDLRVHPFVGGENIAQFVAYATSVEHNTSSPAAIYNIGILLGEQTQRTAAIRQIAAPLLGAGAGGLRSETVIDNLENGFCQSSHKDAVLTINILHLPVFQRVQERLPAVSNANLETTPLWPREKVPRVFISYSHGSAEHDRWVASLAEFLRRNGVDARLDIWHLRRGMDLPQFMTNELTLADRVILVSDEKYAQKADGRLGGVGWETMIVQGDLARLPPLSNKYLVIVRSKKIDDGTPQYLRTKFSIHWSGDTDDNENQRILLSEIFDAIRIPPI